MLSVYIGKKPNEIGHAGGWFDHQLDLNVINQEFSKRVIRDIDKSEVINENTVKSSKLGIIPITKISSGAKAVIVMKYTNEVVDSAYFGDNCIKYVVEIAREKELVISMLRFINVFEYGYRGQIKILNNGSYVDNAMDLFNAYLEFEED